MTDCSPHPRGWPLLDAVRHPGQRLLPAPAGLVPAARIRGLAPCSRTRGVGPSYPMDSSAARRIFRPTRLGSPVAGYASLPQRPQPRRR
ncbi:hypothetical protein CP981_06355 [Streptomyces platensis]|uniref:Uncharacterized protein n=1 Tax=Streptomyces platensis TaxID=58346 RepID=A0AAE6NGE2_STRPT|nr:hypothetical protein CP981_06355 [Streptomyces platensis]